MATLAMLRHHRHAMQQPPRTSPPKLQARPNARTQTSELPLVRPAAFFFLESVEPRAKVLMATTGAVFPALTLTISPPLPPPSTVV